MGTNYYVDGKHVGKTSSRGRGNGYAFMWDMQPREFLRIIREHTVDAEPACKEGESCEVCEAANVICEASSEEFDSIGTGFC